MWIDVNKPPQIQVSNSRRRYMVYHPEYGGYVFKCWFTDSGFACNTVESMIKGTHYRLAKKGEKDRQLSPEEIAEIKI